VEHLKGASYARGKHSSLSQAFANYGCTFLRLGHARAITQHLNERGQNLTPIHRGVKVRSKYERIVIEVVKFYTLFG
jgi:hypothetical protein